MTAPDMRGAAQGDPGARRQGDRARSAPHRDRRARRSATCSSAPAPTRCCCSRWSTSCSPSELVRLGRLARRRGVDELRAAAARVDARARRARSPASPADDIRELARALATTPRAVLYGRIGVCTQEFGGLAAWLCYAINALTGHLDEPGGLMFTTPAVDPLPLAEHARLRRRLRALAQPRVAASPSSAASCRCRRSPRRSRRRATGQIRALITSAGNPVLSSPGGPRLERALAALDFMVSIDPYLNETTRLAHVILPPTSPLERSHYDAALNAFAVRNVAKYSPPVFERARRRAPRLGDLRRRCGRGSQLPRSARGIARARARQARPRGDPRRRRCAPGRTASGRGGLSLAKLRAQPHGIDLGPLEPRLAGAARHARSARPARAARCTSPICRGSSSCGDRARRPRDDRPPPPALEQLVDAQQRAARERPAALHAADPPRRRGRARPRRRRRRATVATARGAIELPVEVTDAMMPRRGQRAARLGPQPRRRAAARRDERRRARASTTSSIPRVIDELSGTSALTGQPVEVARA